MLKLIIPALALGALAGCQGISDATGTTLAERCALYQGVIAANEAGEDISPTLLANAEAIVQGVCVEN